MNLLNAWAKTMGYNTYAEWQDHCKANDLLAAKAKAQKIDPSVETDEQAVSVLTAFADKQVEKVAREISAKAAAEAGAKDKI